MEFKNNLKIDKQRTIDDCFKYFSQNILDIETAMKGINNGNYVTIGSVSFGFSQEIAIQWRSFITTILKIKQLTKFISFNTIDTKMKSIFKEYLVQPNINIFEKFQTIIKELEKIKSEINYHYFIVTGFKTAQIYQFDNLKIGDFNQKCPITKISFLEKIYLNNNKIIQYHNENNSLTPMIESQQNELHEIISRFEQNTVIEIANFGDEESSLSQSISDVESFISEIIFLSKISSNLEFDINLNMPNNEKNKPLLVNYVNNKISSPSEKLKFIVNLDLKNTINNRIQIGNLFKKLNFPLYSKSNNNELIDKIKTAINWYSSSLKASNNRESFLFCAIGMEALLTSGKDSITKTLSENTAFLIAHKDSISRKHVYTKMAYLYSQRSGIAHGGNANIEINDLVQLRYYLATCITSIISKIQKNEINNSEELYQYLEDLKFG